MSRFHSEFGAIAPQPNRVAPMRPRRLPLPSGGGGANIDPYPLLLILGALVGAALAVLS